MKIIYKIIEIKNKKFINEFLYKQWIGGIGRSRGQESGRSKGPTNFRLFFINLAIRLITQYTSREILINRFFLLMKLLKARSFPWLPACLPACLTALAPRLTTNCPDRSLDRLLLSIYTFIHNFYVFFFLFFALSIRFWSNLRKSGFFLLLVIAPLPSPTL